LHDIAVYTAITGGRDDLKTDQCWDGADFTAFLDDRVRVDMSRPGGHRWRLRPACDLFRDDRRNAKIHKVLSHLYLGSHVYSIWMDGSVSLKVCAADLVREFLGQADMALFRHRAKRCAYAVANHCITKGLDDAGTIREQIARMRARLYPERAGQHECGVILRRLSPVVERFERMWWAEICRYSKRDQISFEFAARLAGVRVATIPGSVQHNDYFERRPHRRLLDLD